MDINELYPSAWLKCDDLDGDTKVTISNFTVETLADGSQKPAVEFAELEKPMILNKTNSKSIAAIWGDETTGWLGKKILLYQTEVNFMGEMHPCIRIRMCPPEAVKVPIQDQKFAPPIDMEEKAFE